MGIERHGAVDAARVAPWRRRHAASSGLGGDLDHHGIGTGEAPMTTPALPLAQVQDTDCILSQSPLVLRRRPGIYRYGAQAILARCLYVALLPRGILLYDRNAGCGVSMLQGATLSQRQLRGLQGLIEGSWAAEDYVQSASCPVDLTSGTLALAGAVTLVDGLTYSLELSLSSAGAALDALGS